MKRCCVMLFILMAVGARADGPADNIPEKVRPIPPLGIAVSPEQKAKLEAGLSEFKNAIEALRKKDERSRDLLPDVEIFYRAVHDGLTYNEFLKPPEIDQAFKLLEMGQQRAKDLAEGKAPWTTQTGLLVRGYVSQLDGSVQPYGLFVPETYAFSGATRHRLDIWFHGRVEVLTEGFFLNLRMTKPDQIGLSAPRDTIVLYPYGRYCNASKFAGEVDALEALAEAQKRYRIDDERISVRGFSMGGAATWHFAVHYADRWFAAQPGAGFSETPRFLDFFQKEKLNPTWWEKKLWNWYDCSGYAGNLNQCPTVAYSGADDIQKQAADVMEEALKQRGIDLVHLVAPKTGHKIDPVFAKTIEQRMEALARAGRNRVPNSIHFETYFLRYNRMKWVTVEGLAQHWEKATVKATLAVPSTVRVVLENITDFSLAMESGDCPLALAQPVTIEIQDAAGAQTLSVPAPKSDRSWQVSFHRNGDRWKALPRPNEGLRKRPNLQGPIDDAFLSPFIFVRPTGTPLNEAAGKWVNSELARAIEHWRKQFRGYAVVKDDTAVTDDDIATKNLILWGDPSSNAVLKKMAEKLPLRWDAKTIGAGAKTWDAAHHAPVLVYPNPLNPNRYVVLNSSFTYREYAYLNNARQVPMLPDWAIVDLREAPSTIWPGKIAEAGFFDEEWKLK